jgi:hypothetical protein
MAVTSQLSMSVRVLPTVRAPAAARKFARQAVDAWGLPAEVADSASSSAGALTLHLLRRVRSALVVTVELDDTSVLVRVEGSSVTVQRRLAREQPSRHPNDARHWSRRGPPDPREVR